MMSYLIESSICMALFYLIYHICFKPHPYHLLNRSYLLLSIVTSMTIPLFEFKTSEETLTYTAGFSRSIQSNIEVIQSSMTISEIITYVYFVGLILSLLILGYNLIRLTLIIYRGERLKIDGCYIVHTDAQIDICSFFRYIILSKDRTDPLHTFEHLHETTHIRQFHSFDILISWLFQCIYWFNPIAYLYRKRLTEVHEFLADQGVIQRKDKSTFQKYLLEAVSKKSPPALVNNFKSIIKTRLVMMNSNSRPSIWSYFTVITVFAVTVLLFSCSKKHYLDGFEQKRTEPKVLQDHEITWLTEIIRDTIVSFDNSTKKEEISIIEHKAEYFMDTLVFFNSKTKEEELIFMKNYKENYDFLKR